MRQCLLLLLILLSRPVIAQEASLQFDQANQSYREGKYEQAASLYEQIVTNGYEHAPLYYNLGNAYFKMKNIPAALLNYERAKRLAPHDEDVLYNLRLANIHVLDKVEPVPRLFFIEWWNAFVSAFSSGVWAAIAIMALWCAVIAGTVLRLARSAMLQRLSFIACVCFILLSAAGFSGVVQQYQHEHDDQSAIIFAPSVSVKSSPDAQSTDLFVLHEGVKVDILDAVGEWKKIRLADGKMGWMTTADLRVI